MKKSYIVAIGSFLAVVVILAGIKFLQIRKAMSAGAWKPAPDAITTFVAKEEIWSEKIRAVGSVASVQGVMVSSQQEGKIFKVGVESGAIVKAGDLLIQLDTAVEEAQLNSALARENLARISFDRAERLLKTNSVSKAEYDSAAAELKRAEADANVIRAVLDQKTIRAPFAGKVGIRLVNIGQFVATGAPLIPLYTVNPIYVNFGVSQRFVSDLKIDQEVSVATETFPNQTFKGRLSAINPALESQSRNLLLQATLDNQEEKLKPGMFVNVELLLNKPEKVVVIPLSAISYAPYGDSVFVVSELKDQQGNAYKGVSQHFVKLGQSRGDFINVLSGIESGDEVATTGVFKLKNGAAVLVDNSHSLESKFNPNPEES